MISVRIQWDSHANNASVKFPPIVTFLSLMSKSTDAQRNLRWGSLHERPTLLVCLNMMMQEWLLISASFSLYKPGCCQTCACKAVVEALLDQYFETDPTYCWPAQQLTCHCKLQTGKSYSPTQIHKGALYQQVLKPTVSFVRWAKYPMVLLATSELALNQQWYCLNDL